MPIGHQYVFFGEMSIEVFYPWGCLFVAVELYELLTCFGV